MSYNAVAFERTVWSKAKGLICAVSAGFLTTACAGGSGLGEQNLALLSSDSQPSAEQAALAGPEALMKATEYWRKEFQKKPKDKNAALSYARNLKAMGQKQQALSVLQHASSLHSTNKEIAGEYGRLALDLDQVSVAERLLGVADDPTKPDWRIISARGTVMAKKGQFNAALPFYKRALSLAPGEPSVLNNLALTHMMGGDAKSAETLLRQAIAKGGPHTTKARQNLALTLGVQGKYNEATSVGSSVLPKAHASANANYLKKLVRLAAVDTPAPIPNIAPAQIPATAPAPKRRAVAKAQPLTPDQIIAQAKATTAKSKIAEIAKPKAAKVVQKAPKKPKAKPAIVRTVARAADAKAGTLPFKPSSY